MILPKLVLHNTKISKIKEFEGINTDGKIKENQFSDTYNISSKCYPRLCSRASRSKLGEIDIGDSDFTGYFENNGIRVISEGNRFEYTIEGFEDNSLNTVELLGNICNSNTVDYNKKTLLMYDGKGYEYSATDGVCPMHCKYTVSYDRVNDANPYTRNRLYLSILYEDGVAPSGYGEIIGTNDFPTDVGVNFCVNKNGTLYRLARYSDSEGNEPEWEIVGNFCIKLTINQANNRFLDNDYIKISGLKYWKWSLLDFSELNGFFRITRKSDTELVTDAVNATPTLASLIGSASYPSNNIYGYDSPIINNTGNYQPILDGVIENIIPPMKYICTQGNRVWGCSVHGNEIYASELGNARSWNCFEGISTDSYAVTLGSSGMFTSCCTYHGQAVFFKEDEMIIISGNRPSSYSVNSNSCHGVSKDSPDGVCVVEDILFYKAYDGIYAYSGGNPSCISKALSEDMKKLTDVKMCGYNGFLYVCGKSGSENRLFVYDIANRIWHRYSSDNTVGLVAYFDGVVQLCRNGEKIELYSIDNEVPGEFTPTATEKKEWCWESPEISYNTADRKYIHTVSFEMECEHGCRLYVKYDDEKNYRQIKKIPPITRRGIKVAVFPRRCGRFSLKMSGKGGMTLYGIYKEIEEENNG